MTDIASILASYRSGQIDEAAMVEICREWPEVEAALRESSDAREQSNAAMERLRQQLDTGFNPVIGGKRVVFSLMIAEQSKIEPGNYFPVSHISNADGWQDQIAMAKAFIAKAEDFMAERDA
jgi:hypothetical protein